MAEICSQEHGVYQKATVFNRTFLRFDVGVNGENEMRLHGYVGGKQQIVGRGILWALDDPIQLGICAIGMIDRTIYCGAYPDGTATVFRDFKLWTR